MQPSSTKENEMQAAEEQAAEKQRVSLAIALKLRRLRRRQRREKYTTFHVASTPAEFNALPRFERRYRAISQKQVEVWEAVLRGVLWILFGGGKGGAKTVGGVRLAQRLIATSEGGVWLVVRRNFTDLLTTTKQSYEQYFPPELIVKKTERIWYCQNNWEIWFYHADSSTDPNYERIGGLEVTAVHADEVSQFPVEFYAAIPAALRRPAMDIETGKPVPQFVYATCNPIPGDHWTKEYFLNPNTRRGEDYADEDGNHAGHAFIQSLLDDNPFAPKGYSRSFVGMEGAMLQMLRWGNWDIAASEFAIVPMPDVSAIEVESIRNQRVVNVGIDIGLGSPDPTVVYAANERGEMWKLAEIIEYDTAVLTEQLDPIIAEVNRNGGRAFMDAGSVGKGVVDALKARYGARVIPVLFGEAAVTESTRAPGWYKNRRAQLYYWLRIDVQAAAKQIREGVAPPLLIASSEELRKELSNIYYLPVDGSFQLESKKEIKRRIRRSPDEADAAALCNAARRMYHRPKEITTGRGPGAKKGTGQKTPAGKPTKRPKSKRPSFTKGLR